MLLLEAVTDNVPSLPENFSPAIGQNELLVYAPYAVGGIIVLIAALLGTRWYLKHRTANYAEALQQRNVILRQLDLLERDYLKRKVSEGQFQKMFKQKQAELIAFEAVIQDKLHAQSQEDKVFLESLPPKKRHVAQEFLQQRQHLLGEMEIARKKFLKMQIDSQTYQQFMEKTHTQLIEVRAKLHELKSEDDVKGVMGDLKQKLSDIEKEQKMKQEERQKRVVDELVEHLEETHYLK